MDVFSCIATRHSTRKFKEEPVPQELLDKVIEAGRQAPSGKHKNQNHFLVIRKQETMQELAALVRQEFAKMEVTPENDDNFGGAIRASKNGDFTTLALLRGIQVAIDEANERGGVLGRKVELVVLDDQGRAEEAVEPAGERTARRRGRRARVDRARPLDDAPRLPGGAAPGLSFTTADWLHGTEIAGIATDTWGFEVRPNEFDVAFQPLHQVAIPNTGLFIGEMWDLDALAADCAADGVWDFFLTAAPLPVTGAVGAPVNPIAVK